MILRHPQNTRAVDFYVAGQRAESARRAAGNEVAQRGQQPCSQGLNHNPVTHIHSREMLSGDRRGRSDVNCQTFR